jgi:hypothetical protein
MTNSIAVLVVVLIILIVVFFLFRELNCWYWKINKRIDLLEKQNLLIGKTFNHLTERKYFIAVLTRIADPVLNALSRNELKIMMPVEAAKESLESRKPVTYLEAIGRLLSGMAPWLELGPDNSPEGKIREKYIILAVKCIQNATDRHSPDYMNFTEGTQPLVDAAYLGQAILRAPIQLWGRLDDTAKVNVIRELKATRIIKPENSNWLFFSAMIETVLLKFEGACEKNRIDNAVTSHMQWYKGDGVYGDGADFHWDYYNSFVIQPMFLEVLQTLRDQGQIDEKTYNTVFNRARRYAAIQERFISPEGTYPPIGRSLAYRFGAFQLLSKISLLRALPAEIKPQQVRAALYAVIKRQIETPGTFDKNGWLQIGLIGHQPNLGEKYISTGSLYLCSEVFLVLGLPPKDEFWRGKDKDWTSKKVWKGEDVYTDHAIE